MTTGVLIYTPVEKVNDEFHKVVWDSGTEQYVTMEPDEHVWGDL